MQAQTSSHSQQQQAAGSAAPVRIYELGHVNFRVLQQAPPTTVAAVQVEARRHFT